MKATALSLSMLTMLTVHCSADPAVGLEGRWTGKCVLGSKTVNSSILMDQQSGFLNGKPIKGLVKNGLNISFSEQERGFIFRGVFSQDTRTLNGTIVDGKGDKKIATCNYNRYIGATNQFCIRSFDNSLFYYRIRDKSGNAGALITVPPERTESGDPQGTLCWDPSQFGSNECPRSLPLSTYSCGK